MKTTAFVCCSLLLGTAAIAQTGRYLVLADPIEPGQTARVYLSYPAGAVYNLYAVLVSLPAMSGSVPLAVPGLTVLGEAKINPVTAFPLFTGQLPNAGSVSHTLSLPSSPGLTGLTLDLQGADLAIPSHTLTLTDNDVLAAVQAQSWQPHTVLTNTLSQYDRPSLAVQPQGGAVAVWAHLSGGSFPAASRYVPGIGWSSAAVLSSAGGADGLDSAGDPSGNVTVVWRESGDDSIYAAELPAGGSWSAPVLLEQGLGGAYAPKVAVDAAGNATATWQQWDGPFNSGMMSVLAARKPAGQPWGPPVLLEQSSLGGGNTPAIACNATGETVVAWSWTYLQNGTYLRTVMSNRFTPGSGWAGAVAVTGDTEVSTSPVEVAVDAAGNAVVVWESRSPGSTFQRIHAAVGQGTGFGPTARLDPPGNAFAGKPKVVTTGVGTALATWDQDDTSYRILVSRLANGSWSPAEVAVDAPGTWARYPEIVADGSGRITIAYRHGTPLNVNYCYATQFLPGVGWLTSYRIDDNNHGGHDYVRLGIDGQGNVLAVMGEPFFSSHKLVAREFR